MYSLTGWEAVSDNAIHWTGLTFLSKLLIQTSWVGNILILKVLILAIDNFDFMFRCPGWLFLIESALGKKVLF
jgi:hypothetical protein